MPSIRGRSALNAGILALLLCLLVAHLDDGLVATVRSLGFFNLNLATTEHPERAARADDLFEIVLEREPGDPAAVRGKAYSLVQAGDHASAARYLQLLDDGAGMMIHLGDLAWSDGHLQRSAFWYGQAVQKDPVNPTGWSRVGRLKAEEGDLEQSYEAYNKAWQLDSAAHTLELARALKALERPNEAAQRLRQALDRHPNAPLRASWWDAFGYILLDEPRPAEAIAIFEAGVAEFPASGRLYLGLGRAYEAHGDTEPALSALRQAHLYAPDGEAAFALAELLNRDKGFEEAQPWFESAVDLNRNNPRWLAVYATEARAAGEADLALALAVRGIQTFQGDTRFYVQKALAHRALGQRKAASATMQQALERTPTPNYDQFMRAADLFSWAGDIDLARDAARSALALQPGDDRAAEFLKRLEQAEAQADE